MSEFERIQQLNYRAYLTIKNSRMPWVDSSTWVDPDIKLKENSYNQFRPYRMRLIGDIGMFYCPYIPDKKD